jgi:ribosomal protein L24E
MQKLQPDDLKWRDCFGTSVAISGEVAVVGAMFVDVPLGDAGAVYIFQGENGKWQLKQKVQPEKLAWLEWFGHSLAVDGEIALVRGNKQHEAGAGAEAGAVYFFDTTA